MILKNSLLGLLVVDSLSSGFGLFNDVGFVQKDQFSQGKLGQTGSLLIILLSDNLQGNKWKNIQTPIRENVQKL